MKPTFAHRKHVYHTFLVGESLWGNSVIFGRVAGRSTKLRRLEKVKIMNQQTVISSKTIRDQCIAAIDKLIDSFNRSGVSALCDDYHPKLIEWLGHSVKRLGFTSPPLTCFYSQNPDTNECQQFLAIFHPHAGRIGQLPISTPWDSCGNPIWSAFNRCNDYSPPCGVLDALCQWRRALEILPCEESNQEKASSPKSPTPLARHSLDFRCFYWHDQLFAFTDMQAPMVKLLWEAYENGTPDIGSETLLETVDAKSSRLVDIFRDNPAWGKMIVDGATKGSKRIADPPTS